MNSFPVQKSRGLYSARQDAPIFRSNHELRNESIVRSSGLIPTAVSVCLLSHSNDSQRFYRVRRGCALMLHGQTSNPNIMIWIYEISKRIMLKMNSISPFSCLLNNHRLYTAWDVMISTFQFIQSIFQHMYPLLCFDKKAAAFHITGLLDAHNGKNSWCNVAQDTAGFLQAPAFGRISHDEGDLVGSVGCFW